MRKVLIILFLFSFGSNGFPQVKMDFSSIDKHAIKAPKSIENNLPKLVEYLSKKTVNDFEKVRSFYIWMVNNIDYDNAAIEPNSKRINQTNQDVLNRKKAVCQGYSNVFREMCRLSKIKCEVITGYPKTPRNAPPDLNKANHTWNAVVLDGKWYLLDVTWGAGNEHQFVEDYFLTVPENFVIDHLPNDPMWQLLDCPITTDIFKKDESEIKNHLSQNQFCFDFKDSIQRLLDLPLPERKLKSAQNSYRFNPVEENKKQVGSMYMDIIGSLSDLVYELETQDSIKAVMKVQLEIMALYEKAKNYVELYDHQKENLAYTHFNYAVALSRVLPEANKTNEPEITDKYQKMLYHFEVGKAILAEVPPTILSENGMEQFDEYIKYVQSLLNNR